jgi:hypothetical protein
VIVECIGCEFRNRFGTSDPSPSGDTRGNVVRGRWATSGRGAAYSDEPSPLQKGALRGLRPGLLENSSSGLNRNTRTARTKHTPQRPPKGLKGRFQQSQVRKHLERRA